MKNIIYIIIITAASFSCKKDSGLTTPSNSNLPPEITQPQNGIKSGFSKIKIKFKTVAGTEDFKMYIQYQNASAEKFMVSRFQYYLSNFVLTTENGIKLEIPDTHFLLNAATKDSIFLNNIPNNSYKSISFLIGIDSTTSKEGAHSGDLDPIENMYMEWSGYTYVALEGAYNSTAGIKSFKYIIRGYTPASYYAVQAVSFNFGQNLIIESDKKLLFNVDVLEIFKNPETFSIENKPVIETAGPDAVRFSANYKDMFSFIKAE